jgi:hypothetical protein
LRIAPLLANCITFCKFIGANNNEFFLFLLLRLRHCPQFATQLYDEVVGGEAGGTGIAGEGLAVKNLAQKVLSSGDKKSLKKKVSLCALGSLLEKLLVLRCGFFVCATP